MKMGDKAWEGKLCEFSSNSRVYPSTTRQKGTLWRAGTSPTWKLRRTLYSFDYNGRVEDAYERDGIEYTFFLYPIIFDSPEEATEQETEQPRSRVQVMLSENAVRGNSLKDYMTTITGVSPSGVVQAASPRGVAPDASPGVMVARGQSLANLATGSSPIFSRDGERFLPSTAFAYAPAVPTAKDSRRRR